MSSSTILSGLTPEQREAVLHREGPLLILAGAGSGKTRVITRRIAQLIESGVSGDSILAITFTNKAAREMRERVGLLVPGVGGKRRRGDQAGGPTISTFHAFAVRVLRQYAPRLGMGCDFSILGPAEQLGLVREAALSAGVNSERFAPPQLVEAISRIKERLGAERAEDGWSELDRAVSRVLPVYRELLRERNAFDFCDLIGGVVSLLEDHDDVREALLARIRWVLVDEYQDTNHAQYRLTTLMAGEQRNLCVCGDPDQSIYGWRGADLRNILRFEEEFEGAKVVRLERNYRSTASILRVANTLIEQNTERKDKQLLPTGEQGLPVDVLPCADAAQEADLVARRIASVSRGGTPLNEIAVVFRIAAHARGYEEAILREGIPCAMAGGTSFSERKDIKDALAFVRLALNPRDDLAATRALQVRAKVGKRTIAKLRAIQRQNKTPLVEVCAQADQVPGLTAPRRAALQGFAAMVRGLIAKANGPARRLVAEAVERAGLQTESTAKLVELARTCGKKDASALLDRLALLDAQDDGDEQRERVTLTTVHAAKGLEFDVVFCVGLEDGLFPHWRAIEEGGLEEERRLAYVAFTRARQRLVLSWAKRRRGLGRKLASRPPSRFLYELPGDLLWDPVLREPMELPDPKQAEQPPARRKVTLATPRKGAGKKPLWARTLVKSKR